MTPILEGGDNQGLTSTRYPMISKTELGRVGYRKKYRVTGRVWVSAGHCIGVIHKGPKSGCELVTLFFDRWLLLPWVIHTGPKSGCELVTLFDSDCDYGVSADI